MNYRSLLICCSLLLYLPMELLAQKVLQIERRNSAKTKKIEVGSQIIYQVKDDDIWYEATIEDIQPEEGFLVLHNRLVNVEDIVALKTFENKAWSRALSTKLFQFSGGWVLFGFADYLIFNRSPDRAGLPLILIPAGSAILLGWVIRKIFEEKIYKFRRKYRLRLLDLTPVAAPPIP